MKFAQNIDRLKTRWLDEYDQLIETLLESSIFDFTEATNEFNKIVEIKFKNIGVEFFAFSEEEMRIMWTYIENSKLRPKYERKVKTEIKKESPKKS